MTYIVGKLSDLEKIGLKAGLMTESVIKNTVNRKITKTEWGSVAELSNEDSYSIKEYSLNPGCSTQIQHQKGNVYYIVASGTAEFDMQNEHKKLFKGEKVSFLNRKDSFVLNVKNCGVIPLNLVEVELIS